MDVVVQLKWSIFVNNIANDGGAICFDSCPQTQKDYLNVSNVLITNNIAFISGGAIQFKTNENMKCIWCRLEENNRDNLIVGIQM